MEITVETKKLLLKIARNTIENLFLKEKKKIELAELEILSSKCGAFVTLTLGGSLRGCIGYITSDLPLLQTIISAAEKAAFEDTRFPPLTKGEADMVEIEVSLLSEPFQMASYDEIILGKHGLILHEMGRRALLLPQVPIEHGMDKNEYLSAICRKGGFPADLWKKKKLELELFTAEVFSEEEFNK